MRKHLKLQSSVEKYDFQSMTNKCTNPSDLAELHSRSRKKTLSIVGGHTNTVSAKVLGTQSNCQLLLKFTILPHKLGRKSCSGLAVSAATTRSNYCGTMLSH